MNICITQVSVSPGPGSVAPEVFPDYYEEGAVASDKKVKPHAQAHLLSATEHCKVRGELIVISNKLVFITIENPICSPKHKLKGGHNTETACSDCVGVSSDPE